MAKRLVLDTNVLFSIMKPDSAASYLFPAIRAKLFSPEFVTSELERHKAVCLAKSALSAQEFEMRWNEVEYKISFRGISLYERFLKEALGALPDPDDAPYVALALSLDASIWSNDADLKSQELVPVLSTKELIAAMFKGEF